MSSAYSGHIECHLSLSIKSPDEWRQEIGVCCDVDTGPEGQGISRAIGKLPTPLSTWEAGGPYQG